MNDNVTLLGALETLLRVQQSILEQPLIAWEESYDVFWGYVMAIANGLERDEDTPADLILQLAMMKSQHAVNQQDGAIEWLRHLGVVLMSKNDAYGGAITDPIEAFSGMDPIQQCESRIDAKLSRLLCGGASLDKEDTALDLAGYLALLSGLESQAEEEAEEICAQQEALVDAPDPLYFYAQVAVSPEAIDEEIDRVYGPEDFGGEDTPRSPDARGPFFHVPSTLDDK